MRVLIAFLALTVLSGAFKLAGEDEGISESQVHKFLDNWEANAITRNVDGNLAILAEDVIIEVRFPTEDGYKYGQIPIEYYKQVVRRNSEQTTQHYYTRDNKEINISRDKEEAIIVAIVVEGKMRDGVEIKSTIKVTEEMTLRLINRKLKIVRLVTSYWPE